MATEGLLFGMGNPLLEISAVVDEEFLKKYDVKLNNSILATPQHDPIESTFVFLSRIDFCVATEGVRLEISAVVDEEFLKKYDVRLNDEISADSRHVPMYQELADKENVEYIAKEATLYSIKVAEWIFKVSGATSYIGCIGKDRFGAEMKTNSKAPGVNVHYYEDETQHFLYQQALDT